jgi:aspartyl-tRNA(Asn)/glutamyl-tRNA(Gln) amidotransferase subunit A
MYLADIFTVSANLAGVPAISVPGGFVERNGDRLPVGFQLAARAFDEATLLRAADAYQKLTGFPTVAPVEI